MAHGYSADIWSPVDQHRRELIHDAKISNVRKQFEAEMAGNASAMDDLSTALTGLDRRKQVLSKIEEIVSGICESVEKGVSPVLSYDDTRSWDNVQFEATSGIQMVQNARQTSIRSNAPQSSKKFDLMLKILSIMYKLVHDNTYCTKRDIYYQDTALFRSQSVVDNLVSCISCMLKIPRWDLHVLATSKGCVAGDLRFQDAEGNVFDCSCTTGLLIPSHVNSIKNLETRAKFILVIEKDATFQKLVDDDFCRRMQPCVLMTGKGFPDINTRMLLKKLWDEFNIPAFALVDADPHGMEIMAVYRFGSLALAYESNQLTVPSLRWMGIFPSDIDRFNIPVNVRIPLTTADVKKANELLKRPYVKENVVWQREIRVMLQSEMKAEIQSLAAIAPRFLSDVYIPGKLRQGGWI